jgi:hypothetical protein
MICAASFAHDKTTQRGCTDVLLQAPCGFESTKLCTVK